MANMANMGRMLIAEVSRAIAFWASASSLMPTTRRLIDLLRDRRMIHLFNFRVETYSWSCSLVDELLHDSRPLRLTAVIIESRSGPLLGQPSCRSTITIDI